MFKGILNNPENNYHSYIVHDDELHNIGLGSYTYSSIGGYFVNNSNELKVFFNDACNIGDTEESETKLQSSRDGLIGTEETNYEQKPAIIEFTSNNTYEYIEGDELLTPLKSVYELVEAHDNIQNGSLVDEDISTLIYKIQNSLSGCLTFSPIINIHGQESKPVVQVFLKEKNNNSNERKISHKGSPLITEIAKRPTGGKYGWDNTRNINTASGIGIFLKPSENGVDNPKNTVTGNLRLSYNKPLGFWESGTQQILARLLTNLDAAKITTISTLDTIDEVPNEDLYNAESSSYMSQFTIGFALPMSVHNGNPHTFGPNTKEENKKEKIKVVNRSPRKFTKGDVVLCSFIDGEWIVQGFDAQKPEIQNATLKVGRWSFTKLFANSDVLFKDDRDSQRNNITPSKYENAQRIKYYRHMLQLGGDENNQPPITNEDIKKWSELNDLDNIAKLNININLSEAEALVAPLPELSSYDIKLNTKYIQSTIFDQLSSGIGGSNSGNLIGRTNAYYSSDGVSPASTDGYITYSDMPVFWGTAFPDGYSATQISALKNRSNKAFISYPAEATEAKFLNGADGTKIFSKSTADNFLSSERLFMFADDADYNLRQLPAEVALNGSFDGKYSYPIESLKSLIKAEIENENLLDCYAQFLNDKNRYSWLANASNSGNLFALDPIAPQRIQFSPLQAEFAVSADNDFSGKPNFNKDIQSSFAQTVGNFFGGMFSREEGGDLRSDLFKVSKNGTAKTYKTIPFGEYVKFPGTAPLGGTNIFPKPDGNERSNLVGIIAARNKFTAQKGGTINFTTNQYFGIAPFASIAGGQVDHVSILPIGGGGAMVLGGTSNAIRQFSFPQWGALEDSYNDFGTTALHVRVFDQWPDEQTIYDPRYFAILHFNPFNASGIGGNVQSDIKNTGIVYEGDWDPKNDPVKYNTAFLSSAKYEKSVDKSITSVDFRIPTAGHPSDTEIDNKDIPIDSIINRYGWTEADNNTSENLKAVLRLESEWRINPIRRGQLLTNGGFRYYKRVIGIKNGTIENGGEGYTVGDELTFIKEAKARVTAVSDTGAITEIKFEDVDGNKTYGSGFLPSDFASIVRNKSDNSENGKNAKIKVETGIVYNKLLLDSSPQDRIQTISRLTIGSDDGYSVANGQFNTKLTLIENNDGKYEAFYFFHNDIMHTLLYPYLQVPGFGQYVVLEISAA
jgi:hypothetical protein